MTENVTGLDLVELMLRVAAGEPLPLSQDDVRLEAGRSSRACTPRTPLRNFLPSTGRLVRYLPPPASPHVRVDTGVYEGGEVSMHYDPMIAKLVTRGETRDEAISHMRSALNEFYIRGVAHNISFLGALIDHRRFVESRLSTNLIEQEYPDGFHAADEVHDEPSLLIAVAACMHRRYMDRASEISGQVQGYERRVQDDWVVLMNGARHEVEVRPVTPDSNEVFYDGDHFVVCSDWQFGQPLFAAPSTGATCASRSNDGT